MDKLEIKQGSFIQQTQYFIPVEIDLSVVLSRLGIWFFHLSRRTTVIQDLLVRCQFSLVPDNRTNVEACIAVSIFICPCLVQDILVVLIFLCPCLVQDILVVLIFLCLCLVQDILVVLIFYIKNLNNLFHGLRLI